MNELIHIPEPLLLFRHKQATEHPRDGLTLFGPLDEGKPYGIKAGVIGTEAGIEYFERWVEWVRHPVFTRPPVLGRRLLCLRSGLSRFCAALPVHALGGILRHAHERKRRTPTSLLSS